VIQLNGRYKMTSESEKMMIELGGAKPTKSLSENELSETLCNAIETLAEHRKFHILEKIYRAAVASGNLPNIPRPRDQ